jgi:coproporphyrinogen III oxidase-like Fe-S oxidoreductase
LAENSRALEAKNLDLETRVEVLTNENAALKVPVPFLPTVCITYLSCNTYQQTADFLNSPTVCRLEKRKCLLRVICIWDCNYVAACM